METEHATVVSEPSATKLLRWLGAPACGAVLVWLLKLLTGWLVTLRWVPFRGPLELVDSIPEPAATLGALGVGVVLGLVFAMLWHAETLTVAVSGDQVRLTDGEQKTTTFERAAVSAVFHDKKHLVLLGHDTAELARKTADLPVPALADAFRTHGYPWADADPYADDYRRWVPDTPDLPTGANALFTARAKELNKLDSEDARELRAELAKLGVLVRDDKRKQYWRLANLAE